MRNFNTATDRREPNLMLIFYQVLLVECQYYDGLLQDCDISSTYDGNGETAVLH